MRNSFTLDGDTTVIAIRSKDGPLETLVDTVLLAKIDHSVTSICAPRTGSGRYAQYRSTTDGQWYSLHRWIMDAPHGSIVDHINGNTLDNRRSNLRFTSKVGNGQNRAQIRKDHRYTNSKNVTYAKACGLWEARITVDGSTLYLGCYPTEEAAYAIAQSARATFMPWSPEARDPTIKPLDLSVFDVPPTSASRSGIRNVLWSQYHRRWLVITHKNGKTQRYGSFRTREEAARVAQKIHIAALLARLNGETPLGS